MKKRWVVPITVVLTLGAEALLLQSRVIRCLVGELLDDPRPDCERACVLTRPVELRYDNRKFGELQAGQVLFQPCRHDLFLTEPFDPSVFKVYVEFDPSTRWDQPTASFEQAGKKQTARRLLYLSRSLSEGSEPGGAANRSQAVGSDTNRASAAPGPHG